MGVATYVVFGIGWGLYVLLFWRCFDEGHWRTYGFFFTYTLYAFVRDLVVSFLTFLRFKGYLQVYWVTDLAEMVLSFCIAWEVFRQTFPRGSALRQVAGIVLISASLGLASIFYLGGWHPGPYLKDDFVRKIALSVSAWLVVVLSLARYYSVEVGRNVRGMAVGLLVYLSSQIMNFSAIDISPSFEPMWKLLDPLAFEAMLLIWTATLWSYAPNPRPVAAGKSMPGEALSHWEQRWAALGITIRKIIKQQ